MNKELRETLKNPTASGIAEEPQPEQEQPKKKRSKKGKKKKIYIVEESSSSDEEPDNSINVKIQDIKNLLKNQKYNH